MITVFGNLESGNVHKVQMLIRRLAIPYRRVDVSQVRGEPRRPEFLRMTPLEELTANAHRALWAMEARLQTQPWLAAPAFSIADLALYPYTRWADEAGVDLGPYPAVRQWLSTVESEPRFLPLRSDGAEYSVPFAAYFLSPPDGRSTLHDRGSVGSVAGALHQACVCSISRLR